MSDWVPRRSALLADIAVLLGAAIELAREANVPTLELDLQSCLLHAQRLHWRVVQRERREALESRRSPRPRGE